MAGSDTFTLAANQTYQVSYTVSGTTAALLSMNFILQLNGVTVPGSNAASGLIAGMQTATGYAYITTPAAPDPSTLTVVNNTLGIVINTAASISIMQIG